MSDIGEDTTGIWYIDITTEVAKTETAYVVTDPERP